MSEAHVLVDAARLLLAVAAGGALTQLAVVAWHDRRDDRERHRLPAQVALWLSLALIALDSSVRVGEPFVPHLLILRAGIVVGATWYVLERQGVLHQLRERRRRARL